MKDKRFITGPEIVRLRRRADVSQAACAEEAGVDESTWQRWEYGQTKRPKRPIVEQAIERAAAKKHGR